MVDVACKETARAWPISMVELSPAEGFIVWSFRRWVLGLRENNGAHWGLVSKEFTRQMGASKSEAALASFAGLIRVLQVHARRRVLHHHPCCPGLGADEAWMISLIAACQHRSGQRARQLIELMVRDEGAGELMDSAQRLARYLSQQALILPHRGLPGPATCEAAATGQTIH